MAYKNKEQMMKYNNEYNRQNYDRVTVMLPKGKKDELKSAAESAGESVGSYIKRAIEMRMDAEKEGRR